ncbi:MAG: tetratricopeptide repeat protein [Candidatus Nucleicultricaceae bacterium]
MHNLYKVTLTSFLLTTLISPVFASSTQKEDIAREMEALAAQRVEYLNKLGVEHLANGDHEAAIAAFEKVLKTSPKPQFVDKLNYAFALKAGKRNADAFQAFSIILPESIEGIQALLQSNPLATTKGGSMTSSNELILSAYTSAGTLAFEMGKYEDALKYFIATDLIERSHQPPIVKEETKLFVALSGYQAGYQLNNADYKKISFQYFKKYFDLNPKHVTLDMYIQGAKAAYDSGDFATAELWARKVLDTLAVTQKIDEIKNKNTLTVLIHNLGGYAFKEQKNADAYYFYKMLMTYEKSLNPSPIDFYNAGAVAHVSGNHADAIKWLEKSLTLTLPQDVKASANTFIAESKKALHQ